jgi:hypothetical protein
MSIARRSRRTEINIWPAFVDALGQLVIAIIFLLLIFTVAQFLTTDALSGRDQALQRLTQQINELTDLLNLEKRSNEDLRLNVAQLSTELQNSSAAKDALTTRVAELAARAQDETARAAPSTPSSPRPISASPPTRRRSSCSCASLKACGATSRRCARCGPILKARSPVLPPRSRNHKAI